MFLANKYTRIYFQLIHKRKIKQVLEKSKEFYTENHHIIPGCVSNDNTKENMVRLTAREHYICHQLLTKMFNNNFKYKMIYAFWMLNNINKSKNRYTNSRSYQNAREQFVCKGVSEETKQKMSVSAKGKKHRPLTEQEKRKISEFHKGRSKPPKTQLQKSNQSIYNKTNNIKPPSQRGSRRMLKNQIIKHVFEKDIKSYLEDGWIFIEKKVYEKVKNRKIMSKELKIQKYNKMIETKIKNGTNKHSIETRQKLSLARSSRKIEYKPSNQTKNKMSISRKKYLSENPIVMSEKTKKKISESKQGSRNMTDGVVIKRIDKKEIQRRLDEGWVFTSPRKDDKINYKY